MNWLADLLGSSIGKKWMMALTGLAFCGFLVVHLGGNLTIYRGADSFNAYSEHLHALGPLVTVAEFGLLFFALVHILTGLALFYQNWRARPKRYAVNKWAGGRTIGSATMPYTGILMIGFIIFHLINFHFVDRTHTTIFQIVSQAFQSPAYVALYIIAVVIVALHISHGFWSAFQTFGANHPKYTSLIQIASIGLAVIFGAGFASLPLFITFSF